MKRRGIWLALVGVVIAGVLAAMRPNPSLVERSTRVLGAEAAPCVWRSDHELIRFPVDTKQDARGDDLTIMRAETVDTRTGLRTPLTGLSRRLGSQRDYETRTLRLSPDGQWIIYVATGRHEQPYLYVSEVSDRREQAWPLDDYVGNGPAPGLPHCAAWIPDSRRWLELSPNGNGQLGIQMHSLDVDPPKALPIEVPGAHSLLGVTPDYLLVATDFAKPGNAAKSVDLFEIGLYPNPAPLHKRMLRAPRNAQVRDIALSPQGNRLAWLLYFRRVPAAMQWLARLIPSLAKNLRPQVGVGLWVSRRDGTAMHEVGYQELDPKATAPPEPSDIRWTPGGKRISFVYKNVLYTLPVD